MESNRRGVPTVSDVGFVAKSVRWRWLALFCALALMASACGGGNDDDGDDGVAAEATAAPAAPSGSDDDTPAPSGDGGDGGSSSDAGADGGDGGSGDGDDGSSGSDDDGSSGSAEATSAPEATAAPAAREPQYGGTLVFGLEAETTNGLNPVTAQAAVSGHLLFRAIYETLTIEGEDGEALPLILESMTPNDDYTEWVMTMRPGITFHDGTPADGAALKRHLEELGKGTLTGIVMRDLEIQSIEVVDDLSAKMTLGRSVATLPNWFTSHLGYLTSPSMHDLGPEESTRNPIGTGPFMLEEWIPNEVTRLVRNPNYWRTDAEGRQLPYLDAIEFRPIPDTDGRFAALQAGDLDASVVNTGLRVDEYNEQFKTHWEGEKYSEPTYLMFNASRAPFDNVEFRRALAQCTDRQTFNNLRWDGQPPADGPFAPGTPGHLEETGFPGFDQDAGRATIDGLGIDSVEIGTTIDPANLLNTELIAGMWGECGLDVSITQVDQAELITNAVLGNFTAFLWRNNPAFDIATERVWWHSNFSSGIATNFGRIMDPRIDSALDEAMTTADLDERRALAEDVNRAFADGVYNLWFYSSNWLVATQDHIHGVDDLTLPEGGDHVKILNGKAFLGQTWIEQ